MADIIFEDDQVFLIDDEGNVVALIGRCVTGDQRTKNIQALYPGQPEAEDTSDETIPAGLEMSEEKDTHHTRSIPSDRKSREKPDEEKDKIILVPEFITAREFILKRYRLMMYSYMNHLLRTGKLTGMIGYRFQNKILNRESLKLGFMSFWRIDRTNFYTDVSIRLLLDVGHKIREWRGTLVLWCSFDDDDLACTAEELVAGKAERDEMLPMSPYLVPYLRNREVDQIAEKILARYLPEAINDPKARNAVRLAERMGLRVMYLPVDDHKGIPSILIWETGTLPVSDRRRGQTEPNMVLIPANTIVVNTNEIRQEYAEYSIYHECVHNPLHYMAYRLQKLASNDDKHIKYKKIKMEEGKPIVNPVYFMEKQANRGAYGLMMPESTTRQMIREECKKAGACRHAGERYDIVGRNMSWELMIPNFRVRTRMIQLGHIQAKGAMNYADNRPVEPFAFDPEAWRDDQHTFVIDRATTDYLMTCNKDFRELMTSGQYIYADGHVVRNTPSYVHMRDNRHLLTNWANEHVDECCLRFVRQYVQKSNGKYVYGRIYYDADYIRQTRFYLEDMMEIEELDEIDAKYKYRQEFPKTFREALAQLRKKKKITMEQLAEELNTTVMTLSRWLADPDKYINLDLVVTLCLILQLPDWISMMLLKRAHIQLDEDDRRHQAIMHILRVQSNDGIEAANQFLKEKNLQILSI